jgi:hypothetical protein
VPAEADAGAAANDGADAGRRER